MTIETPFILCDGSLTVYIDDKQYTIHHDHDAWGDALQALYDNDTDALIRAVQPAVAIVDYIKLNSGVEIEIQEGVLFYNGEPLSGSNYVARKILSFARNKLPIEPLCNFLDKLMKNPSYRVREDLLRFLEVGDLPIRPDGSFLAYKKVTSDFKDIRTKSFDHTPGNTVRMDRKFVDDDPNHTCSAGLHVCSYNYLSSYGGGGDKVVACVINPKDVVSIPTDYNDTKMRVCAYMILNEIVNWEDGEVWDSPLEEDDEDNGYY